jgi:predicted nucleic acid-binding Zn ribbon protein
MDILLEKLYKLDFLPHRNSYNRINIPNRRVFEFLKYIGKCPIKCFEYKWRSLIVESYNNRKCINCGKLFNTEYNHQIYCSEKCSILYSNKYGNKLKQMKKFI